jgi:hypothetical protein
MERSESFRRPIITLTTDFGNCDPSVGIIKGVVLSICPEAAIIDISHEIPPQDLRSAALCIGAFGKSFPEGAIHICGVDPGVGCDREAVIIKTGRYFYVGPNNGVFSRLDSEVEKAVVIKNSEYLPPFISATFHGRDVFAPVAAHLASTPIEEFGPPVKKLAVLDIPLPQITEQGDIFGEILHFDHFGNAISNIDKKVLLRFDATQLNITAGENEIDGVTFFYQSSKAGTLGAVINAFGLLEIFTPNGNARDKFGLKTGDRIAVRPAKDAN